MKKLIFAALLACGLAGTAKADTTTSRFALTKPDVGSTNWGPKINTNYDLIDNAAGLALVNTFTSSNTFNAATGFAAQLQAANGSATTPIYGFSGAATSGMFWGGTVLGFSNAGTMNFEVGSSSVSAKTAFFGTSGSFSGAGSFGAGVNFTSGTFTSPVYLPDGSIGSPALTFAGDKDTGLYHITANRMALVTNGATRIDMNDSANYVYLVGLALFDDGTTAAPSITFNGDRNTGFRRSGTNNFEAVANNIDVASFTSTGSRLFGTTTSDNAAAGWVGEYISSTSAQGAAITLTAGQYNTASQIILTAGDWDVSTNGCFTGTPTTGTILYSGVGTAAGNNGSGLDVGNNAGQTSAMPTASVTDVCVPVPGVRISISGTNTYYLKVYGSFGGGTLKGYGRISARRVR